MSKKAKKTKGNYKRFTTKEKIEAILLLKSNDHDFTNTAKQVGVHWQTLKGWYNHFGYKIDQELEGNPDIKRSVQEYAEHKDQFLEKLSETKMKALQVVEKAIDKLAENPENITPFFFQQLNNTIKMLHDVENDREPKKIGEEKEQERHNRWKTIEKQIINKNQIYIQNNDKNKNQQ